uniref:Terpene synthase 18 n=1 Tax=Aquilaria sinensis TaxID=210372 RepID=A0A8E8E5S5_9ROSI|nr:terpene synthase 18 [Aquilaria sinensis]
MSKSDCPPQRQTKAPNGISRCLSCNICCGGSSPSPAEKRRMANYRPSSWDYNMLQSLGTGDESRLGLKHNFQDDIISALNRILPHQYLSCENDTVESLHFVALKFRLLRQHGFDVSTGLFENFMDENGKFKAKISEDVRGMLSLYEASQLGLEGEIVLDEAKASLAPHLTHALKLPAVQPLAERITHALEVPFHRRMRRLEQRWTIETYGAGSDSNQTLLQLAKLDFNSVQSVHQEELRYLTRWWIGLRLSDKLSFARDRLMESFFWSVGMVPEPEYGRSRKALTKVASFVTVLDDVFDVYGTLDELELFTLAVERCVNICYISF